MAKRDWLFCTVLADAMDPPNPNEFSMKVEKCLD